MYYILAGIILVMLVVALYVMPFKDDEEQYHYFDE